MTYTATVSPAPEAGTVTFYDGAAPLAGCASVSVDTTSGTAVCLTAFTDAGTHTVTASYSGDSLFLSSSSSPFAESVEPATPTMAVTSSADPSEAGQPVALQATLTGAVGVPAPTGTVQFAVDGAYVGAPVALAAVNGSTSAASPSTRSSYLSPGPRYCHRQLRR